VFLSRRPDTPADVPIAAVDGRGRAVVAATKTTTGLTVQAAYDANWYPTGEKVTDTDYATIPLTPHG
jgi:hypothetical protein